MKEEITGAEAEKNKMEREYHMYRVTLGGILLKHRVLFFWVFFF